MKAVLCDRAGSPEDLRIENIPIPEPSLGTLRVRVRACGLAFPDLLMVGGKYQAQPPYPFIPGMEIAGEVDATANGASRFPVGTRILAHASHGCLAEYALVAEDKCFSTSPAMPFEHAAGFFSTYATAYHAFRQRARLQSRESVLVLGAAGGVGLAAVQIAKAMGARVYAATSSEEKLTLAKASGAQDGFVYSADGSDIDARTMAARIRDVTGGGVDVVCDIVGGALTEAALRALNWEGRLLIIGFPAGIARIPMNLPLLKGAQIVGVYCGTFMEREPENAARNVVSLMDMYETGQLSPHVSATYPLDQIAQALDLLASRQATGKIVVTPS